MLIHISIFLLGLVLLVKGSDFFVEAASRIARRFKISEFLIGITLVAVGTSIPELSASIIAAIKNQSGIIVGNIVGSNIANIGLIIGISAVISTIKSNKRILRIDGYIMMLAAILFLIFAINGKISMQEGIIFLIIYSAYIIFMIESKDSFKKNHFSEFLDYFMYFRYLTTIKKVAIKHIFQRHDNGSNKKISHMKTIMDIIIIIFSILAIIVGADYIVKEGVWFANFFNVPSSIIALSVIAIGTSLPELGVAIMAARKGFDDILLGNIVGSNIVNILLIIGITSIIKPIQTSYITIFYTIPFMILMSGLLIYFLMKKSRLERKHGIAMLAIYIIFMVAIFVMM